MKRLILIGGLISASFGFSQMAMTGTAYETSACNCYQLTDNTIDQNGHIWSSETIDLTDNFDFNFTFSMGAEDMWGADGMMFVLQTGTVSGGGGNGLGYFGIPNSVGIEIDIFDSGTSIPSDPAEDHVAINSGGANNHNVLAPVIIPNMEDGAVHDLRIIWVGSANFLTVMIDGVTYISVVEDLSALIGSSIVHWGFTGSTGGLYNPINVCFDRTAYFTSDESIICPGIDVNFTDGSASDLNTWNWEWDFMDGSPIDNSENPTHSFTTPGDYDVELTITDPSGCQKTYVKTITVKDSLSLTMSMNDVSCFGLADGDAAVTASTGTGPWSYLWDDTGASTTAAISGLGGTTYYTATVTDSEGCVGIDSVLITEPEELIVTVTGTDAVCFEGNDGTATATVTGGTGTIGYLWDDPSTQTTSTAINLTAGDYNVSVTDANGCNVMGSITIGEGDEITATATGTMDDGTGGGSIDITPGGGLAPYTFLWSNGSTGEDINNVAAGTYTVTITDANGCTETFTFQVGSSVSIGSVEDFGFSVYPNPSNGLFNVEGTDDYTIAIYDLTGKLVYSERAQDNVQIDLTFVESGIYMIEINQNGNKGLSKLIKN